MPEFRPSGHAHATVWPGTQLTVAPLVPLFADPLQLTKSCTATIAALAITPLFQVLVIAPTDLVRPRLRALEDIPNRGVPAVDRSRYLPSTVCERTTLLHEVPWAHGQGSSMSAHQRVGSRSDLGRPTVLDQSL